MSNEYELPLKLGTLTEFGEIVAVKWIEGERYYFCINEDKTVSFLPSEVLQPTPTKVADSKKGKASMSNRKYKSCMPFGLPCAQCCIAQGGSYAEA